MSPHPVSTWCAAAALALAALAAPARGQIALTSPSISEHAARPGERYRATLLVANNSDVPQDVRVYKTDYRAYADGRTYFDPPGSAARSNAGWIAVAESYVTVPPHAVAPVAYTVAVPADGGTRRSGSYWSLLMVEAEPRDAPPAAGLVTKIRYATQVVTHVDAGADAGSARVTLARPVTAPATTAGAAGGRTLHVDVGNTGDRATPVALTVELFAADGSPAGRVQARLPMLYPGTSARQPFALPALRAGTYRALVVADTGDDEVVGVQFTLTF